MPTDAAETDLLQPRLLVRHRRRNWLLYLLLSVLIAVFFHAVVFGGQVFFFRDFGLFFYPKRFLAAQAVRELRIPFWESLSGGGIPVLGAYQSAVFYPFALIYYVFPMPYSLMIFVVVHFLLTGIGAFWMLRAWGAQRFGAAAGALLWTFAPAFVSIVDNVSFITSLAWMPFCLAFGRRLFLRPSRGVFAGLTVSLTMALLAGAPEPVMFIGAAIGTLIACELAFGIVRKHLRPALKAAALALACAVIAALLAGVELVPFFEHLKHSERAAGLPLKDAMTWAMAPGDLLRWILPRFYLCAKRGGIYWPAQAWLKCVYLGAAAPVLVAWTVFALRRRRNVFFVVIGVFFALLSFGGVSPLWRLFYKFVPGFGLIRYPVKFFLPVALASSALAGFALDDLSVLLRRRPGRTRLLFFILAAAGLVCIIAAAGLSLWPDYAREHILPPRSNANEMLTPPQALDQFNSSVWSFARTGIALVACALAVSAWGMKIAGKRSLGLAALACFLVADVFSLGLDLNPTTRRSIYASPPAHLAGLQTGPGAGRVLETKSLVGLLANVRVGTFGGVDGLVRYLVSIKGDAYWDPQPVRGWARDVVGTEFPTVSSLDRYLRENSNLLLAEYAQYDAYKEAFYPSSNLLYGVPVANPGEVLKVKWDAELYKKLMARGAEGQAAIEKLYAVATVIDWTKNQFETAHSRPQEIVPRAVLVNSLTPCDSDQEVLETVMSPGFDPSVQMALPFSMRDAAVRSFSPLPGARGDSQSPVGTVSWLADNGNRQILAVDSLEPAYLYVADNFYPDIRAKVDGRDAPVLRANYAFRAVRVEAGSHTVEFYFHPRAFYSGLAATCLGAAILLIASFALGRRKSA